MEWAGHNPRMTPPTDAQLAAQARVRRLAHWLDQGLRVPGTSLRFGLEPLLGLLPLVGDAAGLLLSLWLIWEARRAGAPGRLQLRMLGNALLDAGAGALPLVGDLFDFCFRANARNAELLRAHFEPDAPAPRRALLPGLAGLLCLLALLTWRLLPRAG
jgi:hypothetical protein